MKGYLIKTVETIRCNTEAEAQKLIDDSKNDTHFTLTKYSSEYKEQKSKGEVIDSWYRVTLTKEFNIEKEIDSIITITYGRD